MTHTLHLGDCRDVLATMGDATVDAIVCDPPYELGFMGKAWDASGIAYDVTVWTQCLRVLKPGGHLIAFGGSRTYHRLAVAIEDAGFEIRDQIQWIYGSGFPKSLDVSKAMDKVIGTQGTGFSVAGHDGRSAYKQDLTYRSASGYKYAPSTDLAKQWHGWGTALKPAHEPAVLARKPLRGTVADNVAQWGTGALNIEGTRVAAFDGYEKAWDTPVRTNISKGSATFGTGKSSVNGTHAVDISANKPTAGRWPSNVILDEEAAQVLDEQSGESVSHDRLRRNRHTATFALGEYKPNIGTGYVDFGGASRFFYVAKASKAEREAGLHYEEWKNAQSTRWSGEGMPLRQDCTERKTPMRANHHPTVKPLALMRYLVRMVTPPGGIVLDPFMGSGSTGCAAVREGFDFVGIDLTEEYVDIAQKRIDWHACTSPLDNVTTMNIDEEEAEA